MNEFLMRAADWWLGTAIGGGVVLLVGCGLMRLTRQPAARQRLGEYAVLAALVVAGLRLLPVWLPVDWAGLKQNPPPSPGFAGEGPGVRVYGFLEGQEPLPPTPLPQSRERGEESSAAVQETATPPTWTWHDATAGLMVGYLLVASGLAARWLLGQWALNRLLRQARPAAPRVRRLFKAMRADTLGLWPRLRRRTHLRVARRLRAPVCFGLRRPAVLLPEPMADAADAQLRWVFAHELTHLRRRDPWSSWGLGLAQAVYFFLPWFWWVRRQVRLCQEYVADAAAADAGAAADEYAEFLVSLARGAAPLGATGLGTSSDLLRRVQMLLQPSTRVHGSWPRGRSLLAASGMLAVAIFAGGVGLRAESPKDDPKVEVRSRAVVITDGEEGHAAGEPVKITVKVIDDGDEKKSDKDGKPTEKKDKIKIIHMTMQIDAGNGPITIPLDAAGADIGKEIEKALKKAHDQLDNTQKLKQRLQATDKALELLKGELSDTQIKQLQRQIEAMRAQRKDAEVHRWEAEKAAREAREQMGNSKLEEKLLDLSMRKNSALDGGAGANHPVVKEIDDQIAEIEKALGKVQPRVNTNAKRQERMANQGMMGQAFGGWRDPTIPTFTVTPVPAVSRLGVQAQKPTADLADQLDLPKDQGLVIVGVLKDSPAAKAGLKVNDILLEFAGKQVSSDAAAFGRALRDVKSNDEVPVVIMRKGRKEKLAVKLSEAKKEGVFIFGGGGDSPVQMQLQGKLDFTPGINGKPNGVKIYEFEVAPKAEPPKPPTPPKPDAPSDLPKSERKQRHQNRSVSVQVTNGNFTAHQVEDGLELVVTGKVKDGKVDIEQIQIGTGDRKTTYTEIDDVPEKDSEAVKKLIANSIQPLNRFHSPPEDK